MNDFLPSTASFKKGTSLNKISRRELLREIRGDDGDGGDDVLKYFNTGSSQTPTTLNLDLHWAKLKLRDRWNASTILRFCAWSRNTPDELASAVGIEHRRMARLLGGVVPTGTEAFCLTQMAVGQMGHTLASELLGGLPPILTPVIDDQT